MRAVVLFAALPLIAGAGVASAAAPALTPLPSGAAVPAIHLAQATVVIAPTAPPPLRVETIPPPPAQNVIWQPGYWSWSGSEWQWIAGRYVEEPRPNVTWVPGHWTQESQGWVWDEGHWQS